ncbi:MAG: HPr(Ser) kinase/phosphatase [Candidatus Schekmanbacteria bacterium]|nr:HPr(Ser) kinase/phosphatase [Candidatus Schekmanbacteria bacterium]
MEFITVGDLFSARVSQLGLQLISGEKGLVNKIVNPRIQKPGLALAGYLQQVHPQRVQVLGQTEISYLSTLSEKEITDRITALCGLPIACLIVTTGLLPPPPLIECAQKHNIPLIKTDLPSSTLINRLTSYLEEQLAAETYLHGVLVSVYGVGVLILGPSGIGKSECALELIARGHHLISDDVVKVKLRSSELIVGSSPDLSRHYIEIRGIGILNIKDLFGVAAVREKKQVELVIKLKPWEKLEDCERLGLNEQVTNILGVGLPLVEIPVAPGRNLAVIIEVAARNQLLRQNGYNSAKAFEEKLVQQLSKQRETAG